jgi:hypothetical protein|tara:strand:- start:1019 stop:1435 length:417 start_codon:yes stop_codon:yes gene_type:complete
MGFKLALVLGFLLIGTAAGSFTYIKYLNEQIATLKGNQIVLETKIEEQNASIKNYLAKQESVSKQIVELEAAKNVAMREVNELKNTFAKHDLNNLALVKPKLIETRINKGTKRVMQGLTDLTNPKQFDEKNETSTVTN